MNDAAGALRQHWLDELHHRPARVVLTDGADRRAIAAAGELARLPGLQPVLVGDPAHIHAMAAEAGVVLPPHLEVIDPDQAARSSAYRHVFDEAMATRRLGSGRRERLRRDPLYVGASAVHLGRADACVGGATRPTADVIRAGLHILGLAAGATCLTSSFLMVLPDGRLLGYGEPRPKTPDWVIEFIGILTSPYPLLSREEFGGYSWV